VTRKQIAVERFANCEARRNEAVTALHGAVPGRSPEHRLRGTSRRNRTHGRQSRPPYTAVRGARMGKLTQLRGVDIVERDGIHAMSATNGG
jgi:hypothetical protein